MLHKSFWILSHPRTGSNYLAEVLNKSKIFTLWHMGIQEYFFHEPDMLPNIQAKHHDLSIQLDPTMYWFKDCPTQAAIHSKMIMSHSQALPCRMKIHRRHFLYHFIDDLFAAELVKRNFQQILLLCIWREDLVQKAASLYIAMMSKVFALPASEAKNFERMTIPWDTQIGQKVFNMVKDDSIDDWDQFINYMNNSAIVWRFTYDQMIDNPVFTITQAMCGLFKDSPWSKIEACIARGVKECKIVKSKNPCYEMIREKMSMFMD